jgi:hypothetical protein
MRDEEGHVILIGIAACAFHHLRVLGAVQGSEDRVRLDRQDIPTLARKLALIER